MGVRFYGADRLIQRGICQHRKERSEDLFPHNRIVPGNIGEDGWDDAKSRRI